MILWLSGKDCQRMMNAIEPGIFIPPHRYTNTSEDVVVLRLYSLDIKDICSI